MAVNQMGRGTQQRAENLVAHHIPQKLPDEPTGKPFHNTAETRRAHTLGKPRKVSDVETQRALEY